MAMESAVLFPIDGHNISTTSRASALPALSVPSPVNTVSTTSIHKEVGHELLERERKRHRKEGEVPYPLVYTSANLNFDTIDHLILKDVCGGLTLKPLDKPPRRVLDLGCGGGIWVLAAAQQWQKSTFVGFDVSQRQPDLSRSMQEGLARRVNWVHGNFLEVLPFPDGEFDYARIQNIGLGVPEDEWQNVVEEVVRVLTPGGTLEIIEEDLIFPCPDTPITRTPRASPTPRVSRTFSRSTAFPISELDDGLGEPEFDDGEHGDDHAFDFGTWHSPRSVHRPSIDTVAGVRLDQRDHSRLKEAFLQMLSARFINPQVLTVLPFYLQAAFAEVQALENVKLYLPPPSGVVLLPRRGSSQALSEESDNLSYGSHSSSSTTLVDSLGSASSSPTAPTKRMSENKLTNGDAAAATNDPTMVFRARMQLSRTLAMVRGCKEALWVEYEKLHRHERPVPNSRLDRDDFEMYFHNWECDMQDRIGMREAICAGLRWPLPSLLPKPDWQDWREKGDTEDVASFYASARPELLRSLRGFVCKKPTPPPTMNGHAKRSSR